MNNGIIALDVDGTLTVSSHEIPTRVIKYLHKLQQNGYTILIITGRPYNAALRFLGAIQFDYQLAVQNGADIFQMPSQKRISQSYLPRIELDRIIPLVDESSHDIIAYCGSEKGDICAYARKHASGIIKDHIEMLRNLSKEPWENLDDSDALKYSLVKIVGYKENLDPLHDQIKEISELESCIIQVPSDHRLHMILLNSNEVNKGRALQKLISHLPEKGHVIAAGDDFNDLSMLKIADTAIVMGTAPEEIKKIASLVAPSAKEEGIIEALQTVTGIVS